MSDKVVTFHDTTFRDGVQSLWALKMNYGMLDAVASEMDQAGFASIELNKLLFGFKGEAEMFGQDLWALFQLIVKKFNNTPLMFPTLGMMLSPFEPPVSASLMRYYLESMQKVYQGKLKRAFLICCTRDEVTREFPIEFPLFRNVGIEPIPYITYTVSPRHTDEYYGRATKEITHKFKPVGICLKDVDGLLTPERARTLIPVIMKNAHGIPLEVHLHGMSGLHEAVAVEAMRLGVREFQTCIPPLANGSSHLNIFNVAHNARVLGLQPSINEEPLRVVEERLTRIAKEEGLPIGAPVLYDERVYRHMVPGGVISILASQLNGIKMGHKLDEVLDEIPRIIADLGYPIMVTPHSQFIVTQAAMNVILGERYKDIIDGMIEFALGIYGVEDAGLAYMDQNLKDKLLNHPNAKKIAEKWERRQEEDKKELSNEEIKAKFGVAGCSDEEFWMKYSNTDMDVYNKVRASPHKTYYFGKEPLVVLLNALKKENDISRLTVQKGTGFFDFRTK